MAKLVLIRHGQSIWNKENRFTGWVDVDLSKKGEREAKSAAKKIRTLQFDVAYTSALKRAIKTLDIILKTNKWKLPTKKNKALNERMYGDLQGKNKDEMRKIYGEKQVHIWRRSYSIAPPNGESLKDTSARTLPYFKKYILKEIKAGKNVLVSAHGNSLRSIVMYLEKLTRKQVLELNIPTGVPYIYELNSRGKIIKKQILN